MNYESILIITYGRTGSTLLMGLLNTIPGVLIRGENMNLCFGLYKAWQSFQSLESHLTQTQQMAQSKQSTHPFFGGAAMDQGTFLKDARALLEKQLVPDSAKDVQCWGFKEIRYLADVLGGSNQLGGYLDFLNILMPNPAFLILTRRHRDVLKSGFWKTRTDKEAVARYLTGFEKQAIQWMEHRRNVFHIDYNDVVTRNDRLKSLYSFLGAAYDDDLVRCILENPHSYDINPTRLFHTEYSLQVQFRESDRVAALWVDDDILSVRRIDDQINLRGVAVVQQHAVGEYRLLAVDAHGDHQVEWGIDSPKCAEMFPDNRRAAHARFAVQGLSASQQQPVELYLLDPQGNRELLCQATISK